MAVHLCLLVIVVLMAGCSPPSVAGPAASASSTAAIVASPIAAPIRRPPAKKGERPIDAIERVLVISIDGLRPDLALRAYMPRLRALCAAGSYTFWAETAAEAYTLPCHVSMLTGVSSDKHGVTWNEYIEEAYPNSPTLFEVAREAGYTTAVVSGKMKFITLLRPVGDAPAASPILPTTTETIQNPKSEIQNPEPLLFQRLSFRASNTVGHFYLPDTEPVSDQQVAAEAVRMLRRHRPEVFFVHFPCVDTVGHEHGWGTAEQIAAIEGADSALGQVLDALAELELTDSTLVILTADHGGAGLDHQAGDARAHFIPWIISGPGIRCDYDLTLSDRVIRIEDTFATACCFLGIASAVPCEGACIMEILERGELPSAGNALQGIRRSTK